MEVVGTDIFANVETPQMFRSGSLPMDDIDYEESCRLELTIMLGYEFRSRIAEADKFLP